MSLLAAVLAETEELAPLILPPLVFGGIAVAAFVLIGLVTWSFRDISNRHSQKFDKSDAHGAGH